MPNQVFTAAELTDIVLLYDETQGNRARALRLYRERFPNRRHPHNSRVIVNAVQRLREDRPITGNTHVDAVGNNPLLLGTISRQIFGLFC